MAIVALFVFSNPMQKYYKKMECANKNIKIKHNKREHKKTEFAHIRDAQK